MSGSATATRCTIPANWCCSARSSAVISPTCRPKTPGVGACAMRSRETALGATIRFFERYAGIDRAGKTHRPSGPGLPDGGVGVLPDAVPDRLLGAWIADDVCACEAFFIEGKTKSEPCGLPKRGALPVFAFACACGLYFARGGRLADVPEPGRPEVWLLFLQFQTVLRLVRAARIRGVSPPPVDVFGFERYPETVRRLKACVEGAATDARG
ncbi:hypothetical protein [Alistipes sp.]|uniref:hypothetical protein n=1 Tax=Alistipes sp. TaxID=1872444 RepID=UPI003AF9CA82